MFNKLIIDYRVTSLPWRTGDCFCLTPAPKLLHKNFHWSSSSDLKFRRVLEFYNSQDFWGNLATDQSQLLFPNSQQVGWKELFVNMNTQHPVKHPRLGWTSSITTLLSTWLSPGPVWGRHALLSSNETQKNRIVLIGIPHSLKCKSRVFGKIWRSREKCRYYIQQGTNPCLHEPWLA